MNTRASRFVGSLLLAALLLASGGCQLIATFDRSKIPTDAGQLPDASFDAGAFDAGALDASLDGSLDAELPTDAGRDSGRDASSDDAGSDDAGSDDAG